MFLAAAVLVSCGRGGNVVVTGTIQGAKNGTLYLQHEVDGLYRNVDSVEMKKNGRFELSADVDSPEVYYLAFGKSAPVISFFAEPGTVNVSARIGQSHRRQKPGIVHIVHGVYAGLRLAQERRIYKNTSGFGRRRQQRFSSGVFQCLFRP